MKEAILQWLRSKQHYETGVALYDTYGKDNNIKRMLQQGKSPFRQQALCSALKAVLMPDIENAEPKSNAEQKSTPIIATVLPEAKEDPEPKVNAATEALPTKSGKDPYQDQWTPMFIEMNTLRHQLRYMATDVDRAEAAVRILSLRESCKQFWDKRDYFRRTGQMPAEPKANIEPAADPNQLQRRLYNVLTYITKAKKALEADPENKKAQMRLVEYMADKDELIHRLNLNVTDDKRNSNTTAAGG